MQIAKRVYSLAQDQNDRRLSQANAGSDLVVRGKMAGRFSISARHIPQTFRGRIPNASRARRRLERTSYTLKSSAVAVAAAPARYTPPT